MRPALIKLSYRQIIDAAIMERDWEKALANASYSEFLLKSQSYNLERKYTTFQQMVANDGRANSLHVKCAFPISPYMALLNNLIPGLTDNSGAGVKFDEYRFTLIDSDITTKYAHKFSITYFTGELTFIDAMHDYLVLANGNKREDLFSAPARAIEGTCLLKVVPGLSIHSYELVKAYENDISAFC